MFVCHNILIHLNSGSLLSLFPYSQNEVSRAIELREIVTSLGPAYIKLGQALSIRPDILSPAAMTELQKLCDKVRSSPFFLSYTRPVITFYLFTCGAPLCEEYHWNGLEIFL